MKYLIVGLGNIGREYEDTRHNIGFMVADALVSKHDGSYSNLRHAYYSELRIRGKTACIIKPTTYMNLSGKAVNFWMQREKISPEGLLVVTDDLALPFGKQRLRLVFVKIHEARAFQFVIRDVVRNEGWARARGRIVHETAERRKGDASSAPPPAAGFARVPGAFG